MDFLNRNLLGILNLVVAISAIIICSLNDFAITDYGAFLILMNVFLGTYNLLKK